MFKIFSFISVILLNAMLCLSGTVADDDGVVVNDITEKDFENALKAKNKIWREQTEIRLQMPVRVTDIYSTTVSPDFNLKATRVYMRINNDSWSGENIQYLRVWVGIHGEDMPSDLGRKISTNFTLLSLVPGYLALYYFIPNATDLVR